MRNGRRPNNRDQNELNDLIPHRFAPVFRGVDVFSGLRWLYIYSQEIRVLYKMWDPSCAQFWFNKLALPRRARVDDRTRWDRYPCVVLGNDADLTFGRWYSLLHIPLHLEKDKMGVVSPRSGISLARSITRPSKSSITISRSSSIPLSARHFHTSRSILSHENPLVSIPFCPYTYVMYILIRYLGSTPSKSQSSTDNTS